MFLKKEVLYLGHLVSWEGISTDPTKVGKVAGWPKPTSTKEVQQFLSFASYYQHFIRDFSQIAKPLHQLTERNYRFKWTPECQRSFEELKYKLTVLAYPDFSKPFQQATHISDSIKGWKAVLQKEKTKRRMRRMEELSSSSWILKPVTLVLEGYSPRKATMERNTSCHTQAGL